MIWLPTPTYRRMRDNNNNTEGPPPAKLPPEATEKNAGQRRNYGTLQVAHRRCRWMRGYNYSTSWNSWQSPYETVPASLRLPWRSAVCGRGKSCSLGLGLALELNRAQVSK